MVAFNHNQKLQFVLQQAFAVKTVFQFTQAFSSPMDYAKSTVAYRSFTLVYPGWGHKSEIFCPLVTTRRLRDGTVVGYRGSTAALL